MASNQQRKRRQRQRILTAARDLFMHDGYRATHVAAVAQRAAVSQVTLYKYFASKRLLGQQVVIALIQDGYAESQAAVDDRRLTYPQIIQQMLAMSRRLVAAMHPNFYRFLAQELQDDPATIASYQAGKQHFWHTVIERGRQAGMITPTLTDQALMMYLDMFTQYIGSPAGRQYLDRQSDQDYAFQELSRQLNHLFFYGLIGEAPTTTKEGTNRDNDNNINGGTRFRQE